KKMKFASFDLDVTILDTSDVINTSAPMFPGIEKTIRGLHERGIRLAIISDQPQAVAEQLVARYLPDIPFVVVRGADSEKTEIYPELLQEIMDIAGVGPANTVVAGDKPMDVVSTKEAGAMTVGVTWGVSSVQDMIISGATNVVTDEEILRLCYDYL
ncbi:MAG: HAD hydrolase-like protein, partial [Bacteroidales bacterium]|nr:HAD hydrolase-like protein [Bacteroidales bacterium]